MLKNVSPSEKGDQNLSKKYKFQFANSVLYNQVFSTTRKKKPWATTQNRKQK